MQSEAFHAGVTQSRPPLAALADIAIVSQVAFLASALLLPIVSEYGLIGDNISELALGRLGWVQTVAFVVAGLGILSLAYAIRQLTQGTSGSRVGSLLVGAYGLGALLAAIFPTDRIDRPADVWGSSPTGLIHIVSALISFLCIIIGMFVLNRTFLLAPRWRSLFPWTLLPPGAALALFFVQSEGPWVGLMQRLFVGVIAMWLIVVAVRARAIATAADSDARTAWR